MMKIQKLFILVWLVVFCSCYSGCVRKDYPRFEQEMSASETRQLYDPLFNGQQALLETLGKTDVQPVVFSISASQVSRLKKTPAGELLWDENKVVFFKVPHKKQSGFHYYYFHPRELRLSELNNQPQAGSDMMKTGPGRYAIFRALASRTSRRGRDLSVYRIDFSASSDGTIKYMSKTNLTLSPGNSTMPVLIPHAGRVLYLHEYSKKFHILRTVKVDGADDQPLIPSQNFDAIHPKILPDGRIVFAANPKGYFRLYSYDQATKELAEFKEKLPAPEGAGKVMLGGIFKDGAYVPAVFTLPEKLDLKSILALAMAHNPAVNKNRALLAAALLEAGQTKLNNIPSLSFGLHYTPDVGVALKEPLFFSGDFLSQGLARGLLGIVQPLLDIKRNAALSEADLWRAEIARDVLNDEINGVMAETMMVYFEARYYRELIKIYSELVVVIKERLKRLAVLRDAMETTKIEILGAEKNLLAYTADLEIYKKYLAYKKNRLKELCGISDGISIDLSAEEYCFDKYKMMPLYEMRRIALLNHPRMKASRSVLSRAFYLRLAGEKIRPTAWFSGEYGQSRREFRDPVDDYITLSINGRIPLASIKARRLHIQQWRETFNSMKIEQEIQKQAVAGNMEVASLDFLGAQKSYRVEKASIRYYLEVLRVERLHKNFAVPDNKRSPLLDNNAAIDYLNSLARFSKVERDLGVGYAELWRQMGLASRLTEETSKLFRRSCDVKYSSVWVWDTKALLKDDDSCLEFGKYADSIKVKRAYVYLYSASELLDDHVLRERLSMFVSACAQKGIAVWALLGEPEWLTAKDNEPLEKALAKILGYNDLFGPLEPKLQGVKLDLEPHSLKNWAVNQQTLKDKYLSLLGSAKKILSKKLPLWADCPPQFLRPEHKDLVDAINANLDGVTLMCYFNEEKPILTTAANGLKAFSIPVEVGLEFSETAPEGDTTFKWQFSRFLAFRRHMQSWFLSSSNFSGTAFHDYKAVLKYYKRGER